MTKYRNALYAATQTCEWLLAATYPCGAPAVREVDGKWYCEHHCRGVVPDAETERYLSSEEFLASLKTPQRRSFGYRWYYFWARLEIAIRDRLGWRVKHRD